MRPGLLHKHLNRSCPATVAPTGPTSRRAATFPFPTNPGTAQAHIHSASPLIRATRPTATSAGPTSTMPILNAAIPIQLRPQPTCTFVGWTSMTSLPTVRCRRRVLCQREAVLWVNPVSRSPSPVDSCALLLPSLPLFNTDTTSLFRMSPSSDPDPRGSLRVFPSRTGHVASSLFPSIHSIPPCSASPSFCSFSIAPSDLRARR